MSQESAINNKERVIVLVVISVNATVSVLLIAGMVYSFTLITQQQHEITNLQRLLHKSMPVEHRHKEQNTAEKHNEESSQNGMKTRLKVQEDSENQIKAVEENANAMPISFPEISTRTKCCGVKGKRGKHGPRGHQGEKGDRGEVGRDGRDGATGRDGTQGQDGGKGQKGTKGIPGRKGVQGHEGQTIKCAESAHIVAREEKAIKLAVENMHPTLFWSPKHQSENMAYSNGYLTVGVDGYYYIYSQMHYYDASNTTTTMGHQMYIDDREVLNCKVEFSLTNNNIGKYATKYTGGIFKINADQKISVSVPFSGKLFYFSDSQSFFGAFLLHS